MEAAQEGEERAQFPLAQDIIDIVVNNASSVVQHHTLQHLTPTYALHKTFEDLKSNGTMTMVTSGKNWSREKLKEPVSPKG